LLDPEIVQQDPIWTAAIMGIQDVRSHPLSAVTGLKLTNFVFNAPLQSGVTAPISQQRFQDANVLPAVVLFLQDHSYSSLNGLLFHQE
jgi:hypothetical protein